MFMNELRAMVWIELHLNADYYCKHPIFISLAEKCEFSSLSDVFGVALSNKAFNSLDCLPPCKVVELEAFHRSKDKTFSSFLCILALSLVIGKPILLLYPDAGLPKFKNIYI